MSIKEMKVKTLKKKIDEYGKLNVKAEGLKKEIVIAMENESDLRDVDRIIGKDYEVLRYSSTTFKELSPRQVYEIIGSDLNILFEVVKVLKSELKKKIGDEKVDELSPEVSTSYRVKIAPVKKK